MASSPRLLKTVRQIHLYLGVFIAPALLFFAFTGFVQTFSLHETTRGSSYTPPAILVKLGQLHKKQTLVVPERRPEPPTASSAKPKEPKAAAANLNPGLSAAPRTPAKNLLPMKLFFALVSVGLLTSTLTGLYMAYRYDPNAKLITALWVAGILIPVLLTFL